jgi:hypothetical protein
MKNNNNWWIEEVKPHNVTVSGDIVTERYTDTGQTRQYKITSRKADTTAPGNLIVIDKEFYIIGEFDRIDIFNRSLTNVYNIKPLHPEINNDRHGGIATHVWIATAFLEPIAERPLELA